MGGGFNFKNQLHNYHFWWGHGYSVPMSPSHCRGPSPRTQATHLRCCSTNYWLHAHYSAQIAAKTHKSMHILFRKPQLCFCHYNSYYEIWWFIIKIYLLSLYYIILCLSSSFFSSTVHPNDAICEWPLIIKIIQTGFERKIIIIIVKFIHKRWWSHLTCIFHGFTDNWNSFRHRYPMTP